MLQNMMLIVIIVSFTDLLSNDQPADINCNTGYRIKFVLSKGGHEDKGNQVIRVYEIFNDLCNSIGFVQLNGYYDSYDGIEIDEDDIICVFAKEETVINYYRKYE